MSPEKQKRPPLPVRPATLLALILLSALTCGVSVFLALSASALGFSAAQVSRLQWLNLALCGVVLVIASAAAGAACRRRRRERDGFVTVCAWTHRVEWHGRWISFEEYLARRFDLRCTHGICDEAAEKMKRDATRSPLIAQVRQP